MGSITDSWNMGVIRSSLERLATDETLLAPVESDTGYESTLLRGRVDLVTNTLFVNTAPLIPSIPVTYFYRPDLRSVVLDRHTLAQENTPETPLTMDALRTILVVEELFSSCVRFDLSPEGIEKHIPAAQPSDDYWDLPTYRARLDRDALKEMASDLNIAIALGRVQATLATRAAFLRGQQCFQHLKPCDPNTHLRVNELVVIARRGVRPWFSTALTAGPAAGGELTLLAHFG
jgi:hypothetical protein